MKDEGRETDEMPPLVRCNECKQWFRLSEQSTMREVESVAGDWRVKPGGRLCYVCDECLEAQFPDQPTGEME